MNRNPCSLRVWCLGILVMVFLLGVPKLSFAVHDGVNCDSGTLVAGDCTINSEHAVGSDVTIEGNLTIEAGGHVKFTGTNPRQLYVKGNFDIQSGGKISHEGVGTANPGQNGGTLSIIVDGNTSVSGNASVKGGNGDNVRNADAANGGSGGILTFNVCGDFTLAGEITAKGGNGGNSTGPNPTNGGDGGSGGAITINVNGSVTISGVVHTQGGNKGNGNPDGQDGGNGTITINTAAAIATTVGANFNPVPTINLNQVDPAQCSQPAPEGCSQGYWKNHTDSWQIYSPSDLIGSVFTSAPASVAGASLIEALNFQGGSTLDDAKQILLRQAVAALLNSVHLGIAYPRSESDIINAVNAQLASPTRSSILALAGELDADNNLGCPLN